MLWLLLLVPALIAGYFYLLKRKQKAALRYASLSMVKEALGAHNLRRHIPALLFLIALVVMLLAVARPAAMITLPRSNRRSSSPGRLRQHARHRRRANRITAAQTPPKRSINRPTCASASSPLPARHRWCRRRRIIAMTSLPPSSLPTAARHRHRQRHHRFAGDDFSDAGIDVSTLLYGRNPPRACRSIKRPSQQTALQPVPPGSYTSAAIILLTDGQRTGPDSIEAAHMAADRACEFYRWHRHQERRDFGFRAGRCACASTRNRLKPSPI
jgi:Ca-activated chloride channel family protein